MKCKLSICILSHNRPKLFKRCVESILYSKLPDYSFEILVNNDSDDIQEILSDKVNIKYYYKKHNDISKIYNFLYTESNGEFIFFLEDDDYLHKNFFKYIDYTFDINYLLYTSKDHITYNGVSEALKRQNINNHLLNETSYEKFISRYDDTYFQLSQIIIRKNKINSFPFGNNIYNDYILFSCCLDKDCSIKYINKQLWVQTTDGMDNISFDYLNTDERFVNV